MAMRNSDFCTIILTHGRPDNVKTMRTLDRVGYTGPVYLIVDDEDDTRDEYVRLYGDKVVVFSKTEAAGYTDTGDNDPSHRGVVYARNAAFNIVRDLGYTYFFVLDDDYDTFSYRFDEEFKYKHSQMRDLDTVLDLFLDYYKATPFHSIAMGQGGDYMGGEESNLVNAVKSKRKVMNTFICSVDRPFSFFGRINEDVNCYVENGRKGMLFLTPFQVSVNQAQTQAQSSGLTDLYLSLGTYVKSFYSVIYSPSCVVVKDMGQVDRRLHHEVNWPHAVPCIIPERFRKATWVGA